MKYVLKYEIKSKYLHFKREYYKEFDDLFEMFIFIVNNDMSNYDIYENKHTRISILMGEEKNERNSN